MTAAVSHKMRNIFDMSSKNELPKIIASYPGV